MSDAAHRPCEECGNPTALIGDGGKLLCIWHIKHGEGILLKEEGLDEAVV